MAFFQIGNFRMVFGSGTDSFTRSPVLNFANILGRKEPTWIVVDGKETHYFLTTPELYTVIATKGQMLSNGIFKHYKLVGDKKEEIKDSPTLDLLNNPNALQSRTEWMIEELIQTSIFGNSITYGLKGFSGQDLPSALWNLPVENMKVNPTGKIYKQSKTKDIISSYQLVIDGKVVDTFKSSEVSHSRVYNPNNPLVGMSPMLPIMMPISNIRGAYGYRNILINERGAVGIISGGKKDDDGSIPMDGTTRKKLEDQYGKEYGISDGQSRVIISKSAISWTPMVYPTKDLMLFEEISADMKIIIDAYGLNQYLFGQDKGATFTNVTEGKRMAYQDAIIPYANNRAEKLTKYLGLEAKGEWIELDYTHIEALQSNEKEEADTVKLKAEAYDKLIVHEGFSHDDLVSIIGLTPD